MVCINGGELTLVVDTGTWYDQPLELFFVQQVCIFSCHLQAVTFLYLFLVANSHLNTVFIPWCLPADVRIQVECCDVFNVIQESVGRYLGWGLNLRGNETCHKFAHHSDPFLG